MEKQDLPEVLALRCQIHIDDIDWALNYKKATNREKSDMIRKKGFWKGMRLANESNSYTAIELLNAKECFNNIIEELLTEVDINQIL